jgi:digeranylgeranylglycerophospholipid reductase
LAVGKYDVAIIGAGMAGISCALSASRCQQLRIALVEGTQIGSNLTSPLTFADIVKQYDLMDCVKGRYSSFAFHNYNGSRIEFVFGGYPLVLLDYGKACIKMYSRIESNANKVEFINDYANNIVQAEDCIRIGMENTRTIEAKVLVDCSGIKGYGEELKSTSNTYYSLPYGGTYSGVNSIKQDVAYFMWPNEEFGLGGGWFYPLEDGRASFGYAAISKSPRVNVREMEERLDSAIRKFEPYSSLLANAKRERTEKGVIPIAYRKSLVARNILFAGDAAGMATNWTCMGVEPAIKYGDIAGDLAAQAAWRNDYEVLKKYQRIWDADNKSVYDRVQLLSEKFWNGNHYFWEWVTRNDLAYLSPAELLDRMRSNKHLMKAHEVFLRAVKHKAAAIIFPRFNQPSNIIITH